VKKTAIYKLCAEGKTVAVYENGYISLSKKNGKSRLNATHVPLTLAVKLNHDSNVLAATLRVIYGVSKLKILVYRYKLSFKCRTNSGSYEYFGKKNSKYY
jgi:hypothetical protein